MILYILATKIVTDNSESYEELNHAPMKIKAVFLWNKSPTYYGINMKKSKLLWKKIKLLLKKKQNHLMFSVFDINNTCLMSECLLSKPQISNL